MRIVSKPWGREKILEENDSYVVKILEVNAGERLSLQYHEEKLETMVCAYGAGALDIVHPDGREDTLSLWAGRFITIKPGTIHRLRASQTSPVAVVEASTTELDDVVRLEDDYGRDTSETL